MYEQYWGLGEQPFSCTPDPRFLYMSRKHQDVLTMLLFSVTRNKGAVMVTGDVGLGKTTLSRKLLQELDENSFRVAMIVNPVLTPVQLYREVLEQLGVDDPPKNRQECVKGLNNLLLDLYQQGCRAVLIIDEAHLIRDRQTYEELRLLLNFQLNDQFLLSLVLIGQPELHAKIARVEALKQRLSVRAHLPALDLAETSEMIKFRLRTAWYTESNGGIFTPDAIQEIYKYTGGAPRVICQVADNALLAGMAQKAKKIDGFLMHSVIMDFEGKEW
ncbi:MAG TPA: AAA family ATPase [Armatimonadota bacterium]|jgi:general secretion pathway protein A